MTDEPFETSEDVHRDRREHGGMSASHPVPTDLTETDQYQDAEAEIRREAAEGELYPLTERHPFPPTNYDRD